MNPAARKRALLDELSKVQDQKQRVLQRIEQLRQQQYGGAHPIPAAAAPVQPAALASVAGGTGSKAAAPKRPTLPPASEPGAKRPKVSSEETEKRIAEIWKTCGMIVKKLTGRKEAHPFGRPVDAQRDGVPDYYKIITNPMDLGTVKTKLAKKDYTDPMQFRDDMRLIWRNCATYNGVGTPVRGMGDILSDVWEKSWADSKIEQTWPELMFMKDPQAVPVDYKLNKMSSELKNTVSRLPVPEDRDSTQAMSFVEKRKLSIQLGELQGDQLQRIMEIIQESMPSLDNNEDEMELDMDQLPDATLRKLAEYVESIMNRQGGDAKASKAPEKRTAANGTVSKQKEPPAACKEQSHTSSADDSEGRSAQAESPQEVKGSTADEPHQNMPFVRDRRNQVDESATAPKDQPHFNKAMRKADVQVNAGAWTNLASTAAEQPGETPSEPEEGQEDAIWSSFKTKAELQQQQKDDQQRQEEEKRAREQAEKEKARKQQEEQERLLKEEEERQQAEAQRAREEQKAKELAEIESKAGTAQLMHQPDVLMQELGGTTDMANLGLKINTADDDVGFDDDE